MHRLRDALTFPRFAAFTTALTLTLVMLGIYTAATGSGLACSAQWPLCDGGVLPQTIPSFIEWFHRLVAMVTGFFIVGTAVWAWRTGDRRPRLAATLAVVLLPLQVGIGAVTVTLNGVLPQGYSPPTQGAHLVVALSIFTSLTLSTLYAFEGSYADAVVDRTRRALPVAAAALLASVFFGRLLPSLDYTPAAQAAFYGTSLLCFATLLAVLVWLRRTDLVAPRRLVGGALAAVFGSMLLGRDLLYYTDLVRLANASLVALALVFVAAAFVVVRNRDARSAQFDAEALGD